MIKVCSILDAFSLFLLKKKLVGSFNGAIVTGKNDIK